MFVKKLGGKFELHVGKNPEHEGVARVAIWERMADDTIELRWTFNDVTQNGVHDGYIWLDVQDIPHGVMTDLIVRNINEFLITFLDQDPEPGRFNPYITSIINDLQALNVEDGLLKN